MSRHAALAVASLSALLAASNAHAAPPAAPGRAPGIVVRADLDGDGKPETCTLTPDGRLVVAPSAGGQTFARALTKAPPVRTTLRAHRVRTGAAGGPVVVLEARAALPSPPGAEQVLLLRGWPPREVFSGRVGPMGRDAEWYRTVEVTDEAVRTYQRVPHVTRCDGAPTRLHPEVYDFKAERFRPEEPAAPPAAAGPHLVARRQPPPGAPAGAPLARFYVAGASSIVNDDGRAENLTPPGALTDGDPRTAWIEGATQGGRGQFATVRGAPGPFRVKAVRVIPGHGHSLPAYLHYNRLRQARLVFGRGSAVVVDFPKELAGPAGFGAAYWVVLPEPVPSSCVTLVIDSTYPGKATGTPAGGRTAIAELTVFTEADFGVGLERLVGDLASGVGSEATRRLVVAQGPKAEAPLLAALAHADGPGRALLLGALAEVATPASAAALGRALDGDERERRAAAAGLARLGEAAVPALVAILADRDARPAARARVAAQLARPCSPQAPAALVASLHDAPDALRDAVAEALRACAGDAALAAAAAELPRAADARQRADLLRAIAVAAVPAAPAARGQAAAAVAAAAPGARSFAERFRLARAAGALRDARLAPALDQLLGAGEPEVREAAAAAAADLPAAAAAPLLARALKDGSPEVRRAAVAGVGRRRDVPLDAEAAAVLAGDRWPMVRREAASAVADRCTGGGAPLRKAVDDPDREVARTALRGLVACHEPHAGAVLLGVLRDEKRPSLLRETAAGALATLGDRRLVPDLGRLLDELRTEPGSDDQAEDIVVTLARSLGLLGDERALVPLRQASVDPASARLRAAALEAIAAICPAGAARVFRDAEADRDQRVVRAARAAQARCRR